MDNLCVPCASGLLLLQLFGCGGKETERRGDIHPPSRPVSLPDSSSTASRELVQPAELPEAVRATCDSVTLIVRNALGLDARREDGRYFDSFSEKPRTGCRVTDQGAGVPDSIWHIASSTGLDSLYAVSVQLQYPPYLDGDFDGDGVSDAAVLVEQRASGKMGIAVVRRGAGQVAILGAGSPGSGPDDLSWIDKWDVFHKGTTFDLTIHDRPRAPPLADAIWVAQGDSVSAFYVWNGSRYDWEFHKRQ